MNNYLNILFLDIVLVLRVALTLSLIVSIVSRGLDQEKKTLKKD